MESKFVSTWNSTFAQSAKSSALPNEEEAVRLRAENQSLCEDLQKARNENRRLRRQITEANDEKHVLLQDRDTSKAAAELLEGIQPVLKARATMAERKYEELKKRNNPVIESNVRRRDAELNKRELQLSTYAQSLNEAKRELDAGFAKLAADIESAQVLHPLRDYLKMTVREVTGLELRLKQTPTLSPEREALEAALTRYMEQREYLRAVIEASERELRQEAARIVERASEHDLSLAVPPPPPRGYKRGPVL
jgi:hypothetical protein